jgi:hypothetical protein
VEVGEGDEVGDVDAFAHLEARQQEEAGRPFKCGAQGRLGGIAVRRRVCEVTCAEAQKRMTSKA